MADWSLLVTIGIIFMILGFLLLAIGMIGSITGNGTDEENKIHVQDTTEASGGKVKGGGIILIGPVPIVFGTDKRYTILMIILAIVLTLLAMIFLNYF